MMRLIARHYIVCAVIVVAATFLVIQKAPSRKNRQILDPTPKEITTPSSVATRDEPASTLWSTQATPTESHDKTFTELPHFFNNVAMKSPAKVLNDEWVFELKHMLSTMGKKVTVVFASFNYLASVLNWLVAAEARLKPPLTDIIVFCLDKKIHKVLAVKDIPSIYINKANIFDRNNKLNTNHEVWMTRLVVYRLIIYFGHDVMAYDSDALPLINPQSLFDQHKHSDVIGSAGVIPTALNTSWGFTLCMGVVLYRSNPRTGT